MTSTATSTMLSTVRVVLLVWTQYLEVLRLTLLHTVLDEYFDTAINKYLIKRGGLRPEQGARREPGSVIGFCVESGCTYLAPIAYPDVM